MSSCISSSQYLSHEISLVGLTQLLTIFAAQNKSNQSTNCIRQAPIKNERKMENIQCHQKENKSEQALQMIGHVVAKSYGNKRSMHDRRQFYYYYLIMEKFYKINKNGSFTCFIAKCDATGKFFAEMSKKRQRCALVNLKNNFSISAKFTPIVSNNYPKITGKMGFTIVLRDLQNPPHPPSTFPLTRFREKTTRKVTCHGWNFNNNLIRKEKNSRIS
jgi:hypothetical protein